MVQTRGIRYFSYSAQFSGKNFVQFANRCYPETMVYYQYKERGDTMERKGYLIIQEKRSHYLVTLKNQTVIDRMMTQTELKALMKEFVVIGIKVLTE